MPKETNPDLLTRALQPLNDLLGAEVIFDDEPAETPATPKEEVTDDGNQQRRARPADPGRILKPSKHGEKPRPGKRSRAEPPASAAAEEEDGEEQSGEEQPAS